MKKTITTILLALVFINVNPQAPDWAWAKSISGPSADAIYGITTDTLGNVYIIGDFGSTINLGTTTLTSAGNQDIFIVKYDPAGNVIWAKSAGGTGIDYGRGITCDKFGNIYVTGSYRLPSCTFGSTILTNTNTVGRSLFLVKYNDIPYASTRSLLIHEFNKVFSICPFIILCLIGNGFKSFIT
jgi:hypothetical protein